MRIVIDLQGAQTGSRFRGIGRYSLAIARAMAKCNRGHELWIVANGNLPVTAEALSRQLDGAVPPKNIKFFSVLMGVAGNQESHSWRRVCSELAREDFIRRLQPDAVFISSLFEGGMDDAVLSVGRLNTHSPTTAVLYDLIPLAEPDKYLQTTWARNWYFEKLADLKRTSLMFAISDYSKREGHRMLGVPEEAIVNISAACDDSFRPMQLTQAEISDLRTRYGLNGEFIFCTGAMDERKNLRRLIEAYAALPRSLITQFQLALAGKWSDAETREIAHLAALLGIAGHVVTLDHVVDDDLVMLMNAATLFVFPSLQEGFGLPPLEAMACGTATIASNTTSLPEVIGLSEAMFDPTDAAQISALMSRALTDVSFRQRLEAHALEQSTRFSWSRSAGIVLDQLEKLAGARPPQRHFQAKAWPVIVGHAKRQRTELFDAINKSTTNAQRPSTADLRDLAAALAPND